MASQSDDPGRRGAFRLTLDPPICALLMWSNGAPTEEVELVDVSETGCALMGRRVKTRPTGAVEAKILFRLPGETSTLTLPVIATPRNVVGARLGFEFLESAGSSLEQVKQRILDYTTERDRRRPGGGSKAPSDPSWLEMMR